MIADSLAALWPQTWSARTIDAAHPGDPALAKLLGLTPEVRARVRVDGDTVLAIPAVLRGVEIISNAMMKVRPLLYKRTADGGEDDKERDRQHPSWRFVTRRANQMMSAGYFRKLLTSWRILRGNGVAAIRRDGAGRIIEAIPLLPDNTGLAIYRAGQKLPADAPPAAGDEVLYWTIVGGEVRKFRPDQVIHLRGLSPNGLWGVDIVDLMCETFGLAIASRDYAARFFGQGAMPAGIVFAPTGMKREMQDDFADRVRRAGEGLGRSHRMMILEDTAKYQQIAIDPEKAQMLGTRQFSLIEIANVLGIQAHKIGDTSQASYNSLEQRNQEHLDDDLDPHLQTWEDELEEKCLSEEEKRNETHLIEFNRKSLVRVNLTARTVRDQFERSYGLATANDVLRRENQRPIGDVGDTYMVPANMTLLNSDGLPILRGHPTLDRRGGATSGDDASSAAQRGFAQLALHETERMATRAVREAQRRARQGGAAYLAFLDELADWGREPAPIAELLGDVAADVGRRLSALADPPYSAADLAAHVASASDEIVDAALSFARQRLEHP